MIATKQLAGLRDVGVKGDGRVADKRLGVGVHVADAIYKLLHSLLGVSVDCQTRHVAVH